MHRNLADQRDFLSFISLLFRTLIQRARWRQAKTKTRAPKISFTAGAMSDAIIKTFADERLLAAIGGKMRWDTSPKTGLFYVLLTSKGGNIAFPLSSRPRNVVPMFDQVNCLQVCSVTTANNNHDNDDDNSNDNTRICYLLRKKKKLLFKKLTICQLSWGDKTLHWWSFHEDYCNKIHTNKTKREDRKIVSIVR